MWGAGLGAGPDREQPIGIWLWRGGGGATVGWVKAVVFGLGFGVNLGDFGAGGEALPEVSAHVTEDDGDPRLSTTQVTVR